MSFASHNKSCNSTPAPTEDYNIAVLRILLAITTFLITFIDSSEAGSSTTMAYTLLALYVAYSVALLVFILRHDFLMRYLAEKFTKATDIAGHVKEQTPLAVHSGLLPKYARSWSKL